MTLHDAIDQDVFKIEDDQYTDTDLQAMPIDELETLRLRINKKISRISASIKESQSGCSRGGERNPKEWYLGRKSAMSINRRVLIYVNYLIKKNRRTLSDYFMNAAKTALTKDDYERVLSEAHNEKRIQEGY